MQKNTQKKPSDARFYKIMTAAFFCIFMVLTYMISEEIRSSTQKVQAPGVATLNLEKAGRYAIYYNGTSDRDPGPLPENTMNISLVAKENGSVIPLEKSSSLIPSIKQKKQDTSGYYFTIKEPGNYDVSITYRDGKVEPVSVLSVSRTVDGVLAEGLFLSSFLFIASLVLTIFFSASTGTGSDKGIVYKLPPPAHEKYGSYCNFYKTTETPDNSDEWLC